MYRVYFYQRGRSGARWWDVYVQGRPLCTGHLAKIPRSKRITCPIRKVLEIRADRPKALVEISTSIASKYKKGMFLGEE
jgi:hypothetical protein